MPNTPKRILIAVDGSQPSSWAVKLGAELGKELSAGLTLLHVMLPPAEGVGEATLVTDELIERLKAGGLEILEAAEHQLPTGTQAKAVLREGLPAQEIVAYARQIAANFIVMGSRGRGRWASFVLGSTTEAVIRWSHCPVISVSHDPSLPTMLDDIAEQSEQPTATR
jgi:nucleotide-binding universal stress UspA family protein